MAQTMVNTVTRPVVVLFEEQREPTRVVVTDGESRYEATVLDGSWPARVRFGDWLQVEETLIQWWEDDQHTLTARHEIRQVRLLRHAEGPLWPEEG